MINIFVTYRCNLACPYCFARPLRQDHPQDMGAAAFDKLLGWMSKVSLPAVAFIGGEPTLHPELAEMIEATREAGIAVVLFTNGLFSNSLAERLAPSVDNFVVNYNDPALYTGAQSDLLHSNLALLSDMGTRLTFSKNFTMETRDYQYLLEGARKFGVKAVRYDVSRPANGADNDFVALEQARRLMSHIVAFARDCEAEGIRTGIDCSVRLCDLDPADRLYMKRISMKFTGICHPSIDLHPDLSASYCLPLKDVMVDDITTFSGERDVMAHFADMVRPVRFADTGSECATCPEFKHLCQGGCMALKHQAFQSLNPQGIGTHHAVA